MHRCLKGCAERVVLDLLRVDPAFVCIEGSAEQKSDADAEHFAAFGMHVQRLTHVHDTGEPCMSVDPKHGALRAQGWMSSGCAWDFSLEHALPLQRAKRDARKGDVANSQRQPPHRDSRSLQMLTVLWFNNTVESLLRLAAGLCPTLSKKLRLKASQVYCNDATALAGRQQQASLSEMCEVSSDCDLRVPRCTRTRTCPVNPAMEAVLSATTSSFLGKIAVPLVQKPLQPFNFAFQTAEKHPTSLTAFDIRFRKHF